MAVITGGASGIGLALAERLGGAGVRLALADVEAASLENAVARLTAAGATAIGIVTDVSRADDLERLRDATMAAFGRVDILVNNAGVVCGYGRMWEAPLDSWRWVMDVRTCGA